MSLDSSVLLPGETVILGKNANVVVTISEYGLSRFAFDHLVGVVGMRGMEAIGGRLHLTNYRLIFKSHSFNRLRGTFGVFLPTIHEVRNSSSGVKRQLEVVTKSQRFTFVVWGVPGLISHLNDARSALGDEAKAALTEFAITYPERVGDGLKTVRAVETVNQALTDLTHLPVVDALVQQALQQGVSDATKSAVLNLTDLTSLPSLRAER